MTTDDLMLNQLERDQRQQTQSRRDKQSRRRQIYALTGLCLVVMLVVSTPSVVSQSSIGRSLLIQALAEYELDARVGSIQIGWMTPLRIEQLNLRGSHGSDLVIDQLDTDLTFGDLIRWSVDQLSEVSLRGVTVKCQVDQGVCNLEEDFRLLLPSDDAPSSRSTQIKLQDITIWATDRVSGGTWNLSQAGAEAIVTPGNTEATFSGVLTEPGGGGGSLQGFVNYTPGSERSSGPPVSGPPERQKKGRRTRLAPDSTQPPDETAQTPAIWRLQVSCESLPLSLATLVTRRVTELSPYIPSRIHGDATGGVLVRAYQDGTVETSIDDFRVRNLTAAEKGARVWSNSLATFRGDLVLRDEQVIGRSLSVATDFASATIDGAFSRNFSLVGANDNPLRWLNAIDGTATAEIDLAAFDRSLPGVLPLRDDAIILSARAFAKVDSTPQGPFRQSQLVIKTEALRARARGKAVIIDPITLSASVSNVDGQLRADQFEWNSAFGSAVGQGDLRSGVADFEVDFGRFTSMLRPILQISDTTLAGAAKGNIRWSASDDSTWRLSGSGNADNLLITFPSGQSLRRQSLDGVINAMGRWGGQTLEELSSVSVSLRSSGLELQAELMEPVQKPGLEIPMPIRLRGKGRLETVADTLGPWLPRDFTTLVGGFGFDAETTVTGDTTRVTALSLLLTEPSIRYADRNFSQSEVQVDFAGDYAWPQNQLQANDLTVSGTALSMRVSGKASTEQVDLDVQWRARLDRLQDTLSNPIASALENSPFRQVGFRSNTSASPRDARDKRTSRGQQTPSGQWSMAGACEGSILVRGRPGTFTLDVDANGDNVAILQPLEASPRYQMVGPMPTSDKKPSASGRGTSKQTGEVVWLEPKLKVEGKIHYDADSSAFTTQALQVSGQWFASTLKGGLNRRPDGNELVLDGPAKLDVGQVAEQLTSLFDLSVRAEGIQSTPLSIRATWTEQGENSLSIEGNLGWETAEVAGVQCGQATIPIRLSETSIEIASSRIPVGKGSLNLAGAVHYRPGPIWVQLDQGVVAESIRVTPEMTNRWLKYLAPLAAETAQIDGTLGAELDEALIVFDQPEQTRVVGRLNIGSLQLVAGPLANQVVVGVKQLQSLAKGEVDPTAPNSATTLIRMPAQTVDFAVNGGLVSHERLFFEMDRAQVVTSGRVDFDGRLNMIAMVPLDARWLGRDLQGLAGQTVTLPIDGTLSRPSLDSSGVAQVIAQLGAQAVQSTAESYLQQQLNRGLEKLFGR